MPDSLTGLDLRRRVIEVSLKAGVGHIGSALSICDIVAVLFRDILRGIGTAEGDRDRFILSKGHAALALYAALERLGLIRAGEIESFCKDGSRFGVHPEHGVPGIEVTTGSLGMGLSIGAGLALSARLRGGRSQVCVLVSDAECNEGSHWEAVMFAGQHRLAALTAIVDANGFQAMGRTREILDLEPHEEKWRAFGWNAQVVDGHDENALRAALQKPRADGRPLAIIARTLIGKGVSFMEQQLKWHYLPISAEQARQALSDLGGCP